MDQWDGVVRIECYGSGGHFGQTRIRSTTAGLGVLSGKWDGLKLERKYRRKFLDHEGNQFVEPFSVTPSNVESMKMKSQGTFHHHLIKTGCNSSIEQPTKRTLGW